MSLSSFDHCRLQPAGPGLAALRFKVADQAAHTFKAASCMFYWSAHVFYRYRQLHRAAVAVQAAWRGYQQRQQYLATLTAAVTLQAAYQGLKVRTAIKQSHAFAVFLQSCCRCRRDRAAFLRLRTAAVVLQAGVRGWQARQRYGLGNLIAVWCRLLQTSPTDRSRHTVHARSMLGILMPFLNAYHIACWSAKHPTHPHITEEAESQSVPLLSCAVCSSCSRPVWWCKHSGAAGQYAAGLHSSTHQQQLSKQSGVAAKPEKLTSNTELQLSESRQHGDALQIGGPTSSSKQQQWHCRAALEANKCVPRYSSRRQLSLP